MKVFIAAALVHAIVHLPPENPPAPPLGYVHTVNGVMPIAPPLHDPRTDAVLVLEPTGGAAKSVPLAAAPSPVEVRIYGARALPEIIIATPMSQVIFRNDDRRPVTLSCAQDKELFPSAPLPPGARLAVTPESPGQFELRSAEYPHLRATLLVARGPSSRLSFSPFGQVGVAQLDVPEGTYQARLFFLHRFVAAQDVTVTGNAPNEFVMQAVWPAAAPPTP